MGRARIPPGCASGHDKKIITPRFFHRVPCPRCTTTHCTPSQDAAWTWPDLIALGLQSGVFPRHSASFAKRRGYRSANPSSSPRVCQAESGGKRKCFLLRRKTLSTRVAPRRDSVLGCNEGRGEERRLVIVSGEHRTMVRAQQPRAGVCCGSDQWHGKGCRPGVIGCRFLSAVLLSFVANLFPRSSPR